MLKEKCNIVSIIIVAKCYKEQRYYPSVKMSVLRKVSREHWVNILLEHSGLLSTFHILMCVTQLLHSF